MQFRDPTGADEEEPAKKTKGSRSGREEKKQENVLSWKSSEQINSKEKEVIILSYAADKSFKMKTENWIEKCT